MATEHWYRWHHGTVTDPKWLTVASRAKASLSRNVTVGHVVSVWCAMMENASQANPRGVLLNWSDEDIGAALGMPEDEVSAIRAAMQGKTLDGDVLTSWNRRQPKAEDRTAADRKRAQRERDKSHDVTADNVASRDVTVSHNRGEERRVEEKNQELSLRDASAGADAAPREEIPFDAIVKAFHEQLPQLAEVRVLNPKRKAKLRKAWRLLPAEHRSLGAFRGIFAECAHDPFLNGTGPYRDENAGWQPTFDFLIREDQLLKVYERAMHRRAQARKQGPAVTQPQQAAA
jgi:hypothetical protein